MKKHDIPIDDFFREALKDHLVTPSDEARAAFLKDALQLPPPKTRNGKGIAGLILLLLLAGTGIVALYLATDKDSATPGTKLEVPMPAASVPASRPGAEKSAETVISHSAAVNSPTGAKQTGKPDLSQQVHPVRKKTVGMNTTQSINDSNSDILSTNQAGLTDNTQSSTSLSSSAAAAAAKAIETPSAPEKGVSEKDVIADEAITALVPPAKKHEPVQSAGSTSAIKTDTLIIPAINSTQPGVTRRSGPKSMTITGGIYYTPEWMFNTLEGTKFVSNFGIEGIIHFGKFSVRTGAGLSIAKGTNELLVKYNEYMGDYSKLDSMSFTWNPPSQQYVPKFYMSNQDVWDSLMKLDYAKVVKRYTYLQVPLILGYDFWESDRLTIGFRTGPVLSVLLGSKQLSAAYDPGKNRVVSVNDIAPEQVSLNWQVMAGMGFALRLTESLQFEVEPSVKYYFNSVYEKPANSAKPWSIGVRAAFVVKL